MTLKEIAKDGWQPLALLPNKDGFRFIGLCVDGNEFHCVVKFVDGMHGAYRVTGEQCFKELRLWRNIK